MRKGQVTRKTKETDIAIEVAIDGAGRSQIATGIGFLDHMLDLLARHSRMDIAVKAKGDLHIDDHHTAEDVGIALGQAVKQALGDMKGITRYADVHVPMDEALTRVAIDVSGRPFLVFKVAFGRDKIGSFMEATDCELWLNRWIKNYVNSSENAGQDMKARYPLREARVEVKEIPGKPGSYNAVAYLRPWLQMEELTTSLRMVARIPQISQ